MHAFTSLIMNEIMAEISEHRNLGEPFSQPAPQFQLDVWVMSRMS